MKLLFKWINILFSIVLVFIALGVAFIAIPYFGNQALIVRSGSMSPAIDVGSIVVIRASREFVSPIVSTLIYNKGDVIAFHSQNDPKTIITHRIISSEVKGGEVFYKTKGDANDDVDGWLVNEQNVLGKTFFTLPFVGRILAFTKSNIGFPLLVILPAVLVILLELRSIYKEIRKQKKVLHLQIPSSASMTSLKVLLPIFMTIFVIESTFAFYGDSGISANNIFTAAEVFPSTTPTPTPTPDLSGIADHIVISEVQIATSGATTSDFVEFYNPTSSAVNLDPFRLVKRTSSGVTDDNIAASNSIALINGDLNTGTIIDAVGLGSPGGTPLTEGTTAVNPGDDQSLERKALSSSDATSMTSGADVSKGNGFDAGNNSTDFILRTLSQPQNSTSTAEIP